MSKERGVLRLSKKRIHIEGTKRKNPYAIQLTDFLIV